MDTKYKLLDTVYLNNRNRSVLEATVIDTSSWGEYALLSSRGKIIYSWEHRIYQTSQEAFKTLPLKWQILYRYVWIMAAVMIIGLLLLVFG